jgi:hypothetical protein
MSRSTVVRRLTAVIALLAVLCMAAPAVAAAPGSHHGKTPVALHVTFLDQFLNWLATLGIGAAPSARPQAGSMGKSTGTSGPPSGFTSQNVGSTDASYGLDPNGHS